MTRNLRDNQRGHREESPPRPPKDLERGAIVKLSGDCRANFVGIKSSVELPPEDGIEH